MKVIPQTTAQACAKYRTRRYKCECPDFTQRGGSYYYGGNVDHHVCKHMAALISGQVNTDEALAIEQGKTVEQIRAERNARYSGLSVPAKPKTRIDYLELEPTAEELFARFA